MQTVFVLIYPYDRQLYDQPFDPFCWGRLLVSLSAHSHKGGAQCVPLCKLEKGRTVSASELRQNYLYTQMEAPVSEGAAEDEGRHFPKMKMCVCEGAIRFRTGKTVFVSFHRAMMRLHRYVNAATHPYVSAIDWQATANGQMFIAGGQGNLE